LLDDVVSYTSYRASTLNDFVRVNLMNAQEAELKFKEIFKEYKKKKLTSTIPLNKQKGKMRKIAFFTAMINILAELTLRKKADEFGLLYDSDIKFNDDPKRLTYIIDDQKLLCGILSRRFDGVYPSTINPIVVWETKEYYYATTFGSRVADGVYETQLDGHEINQIEDFTKKRIFHVYFIDAYRTWWTQGKSYLCRIIDAMHMGLVDEVIFGKEVLDRWPKLLESIVDEQYK
jgi:hypothetical protein